MGGVVGDSVVGGGVEGSVVDGVAGGSSVRRVVAV